MNKKATGRWMGIVSFCLLLLLLPAVRCAAQGAARPKVAVVLSGGGAKGTAHIGALRVIEEEGIPVDYVVGTSMGSIIGGLYALGYSPVEMDSLVRAQDWEWLLSDKQKPALRSVTRREAEGRYVLSIPLKGAPRTKPVAESLVQGVNIGALLTGLTVGYHDSISFARLPIPFACVAADIVDGSEVVLTGGVLAEAMRTSMAIPAVFAPVRKDGQVLVDGGLLNNFPVDVARQMGADIVIGVDVQSMLQPAEKLTGMPQMLSQIVDIACRDKYLANCRNTDVHIRVDVKGYSSASFTLPALDTLMRRGYEAADRCREQLREVKHSLLQSGRTDGEVGHTASALCEVPVSRIEFEGITLKDRSWIIRRCRLQEYDSVSLDRITDAVGLLCNELNYSSATYRLYADDNGRYRLVFTLGEKNAAMFNLGVRFDTEDVAALLVDAEVNLPTRLPSTLSVTGRLGKQYMGRIAYTLHTSLLRDVKLSYAYHYRDIDGYSKGDRVGNVTFNHHRAEAAYSSVWLQNFRYEAGIGFEYFHGVDPLFRDPSHGFVGQDEAEGVFSYFLRLDYDRLDRTLFPTKGMRLSLSGSLYTDNFVEYKHHEPFYSIEGRCLGAVALGRRWTLLPSARTRVVKGDDVPYTYLNVLGGGYDGHYLPQQVAFTGVGHLELADNSLLVGGLRLRYRIKGRHYVSVDGDAGVTSDKYYRLFNGKFLYGVGLSYGFDSRFGPLSASLGYSNQTEEGYCFVNLGYYF